MDYANLPSAEIIARTAAALTANHFNSIVVQDKAAALEKIKELIPADASVNNGASVTLTEIGYIDYLKAGQHGWKNLHADILAESDPAKQAHLRQQSLHSDFYLGSVHALSEDGQLVIASNTGSQLPHLAFTSPNLILVVGAQKIMPTLTDALRRLEEYVVPLEDIRALEAYKSHTTHAKTLILHKENPHLGRKVTILLVNEKLGY